MYNPYTYNFRGNKLNKYNVAIRYKYSKYLDLWEFSHISPNEEEEVEHSVQHSILCFKNGTPLLI
jgi:hypothetical protein